jgi:hypothetical protein
MSLRDLFRSKSAVAAALPNAPADSKPAAPAAGGTPATTTDDAAHGAAHEASNGAANAAAGTASDNPRDAMAKTGTATGAGATADPDAIADTPAAANSNATAATPGTAADAAAPSGATAEPPAAGQSGKGAAAAAPTSSLSAMTRQMMAAQPSSDTDALNSQIVQAVRMTNSETAAYASNQIAVGPNMMIAQAGGLVAQSAAHYFDSASKLALASKSVLLKNMTEKFAAEDLKGAAEDALGVLITDLLVGTAAAVAAAAGAIEGESAHFALDKIDQTLSKYQTLLDKKGS